MDKNNREIVNESFPPLAKPAIGEQSGEIVDAIALDYDPENPQGTIPVGDDVLVTIDKEQLTIDSDDENETEQASAVLLLDLHEDLFGDDMGDDFGLFG